MTALCKCTTIFALHCLWGTSLKRREMHFCAGVRSHVASVCKVRRIIQLERENVTAGLAHLLHVSKNKRVLRKILGEPVLSKERKGAGSSRGTRH